MESFHVNALRLVANTGGASNAQHFLGQRYLHGKKLSSPEAYATVFCF